MAKALFLSLPLSGHINPSLPLVQELVTRGAEVVYYATDAFAPAIERTGAKYRAYRNAFLADLKGLPEHLNALSWLLTRTTAELLEEHLDEFRALKQTTSSPMRSRPGVSGSRKSCACPS